MTNKYTKDDWILLTVLMRQLKAKEVFGNTVLFLNTCFFSSYFKETKYLKEDNSIQFMSVIMLMGFCDGI